MTCTIAKGDTPIQIAWHKDGVPLLPVNQDGTKLLTIDEFNSMLTIASLDSSHIGRYACHASNKAGQATYEQKIHVNGNSNDADADDASSGASLDGHPRSFFLISLFERPSPGPRVEHFRANVSPIYYELLLIYHQLISPTTVTITATTTLYYIIT